MSQNLSFLNREINAFLQLDKQQFELIEKYQQILTRGAESFTEVFYNYLFSFPATAKVLSDYTESGGRLSNLKQKQLNYFFSLLSQHNSSDYLQQIKQIGQTHFQRKIEPVWIMGAYRLYQKHISAVIEQSPEIDEIHRSTLNDCFNKLLFRDMGMMLEGYWEAGINKLAKEKSKVEELQQQITDLLTNIPQVIWSIDVINNKPLYISPTTEQISSVSIELPVPCLAWTIKEDRHKVETAWARAMSGERVEVESRVLAPGGKLRWFKRTFHPFINAGGKVARIDGIMEEVTENKTARNRLERMATTDSLTGLANRALWFDRINQSIAIAKREQNKQVVVMLLDLNHFKYINDTLGHPAGDVVLRQISGKLSKVLRDGDTLARLGGDEFAILLPLVNNAKTVAKTVAQKIQSCFNQPCTYGDNELYLGVAIGIASYPNHGQDADTLVRCADMAMYASKRNNSSYKFYQQGLDKPYRHQIQLVSNIKKALRQNEFELHYQPKVNLSNGKTNGLEALIRWHHPDKGELLPSEFIPIAEQMGLMKELTEWVMTTSLQHNQHWQGDGIYAPVAINVSARSFQDHNFVRSVANALTNAQIAPEYLMLEITENTLMRNIDSAARTITSLKDLGVKVAIDDFGTGYSSLSYLKRLPIDQLKIDTSFVKNMDQDKNDAAIVMSVIELAHNLGFNVVAEGVECNESLQMLKEFGCDTAQGFHISRPLPTSAISNWMNHSH